MIGLNTEPKCHGCDSCKANLPGVAPGPFGGICPRGCGHAICPEVFA